jgi:hypothetical protein
VSILLYGNGLTEEFKPENLTFTDEEFLGIFSDYDRIRTYRLHEVPNTWCIWGDYDPVDKFPDIFNKIGTDILEQACYSPILFIHDTEIDPSWRLTEDMIMSEYNDFKGDMLRFFDDIAADIMYERQIMREQSGNPTPNLIVLEQTGISEDKRIIFNFDMDKQVHEFFAEESLLEFANKVHNFLKFSYKDGDIFAIYADKNIIMVMKEDHVNPFIQKIIAFFESKENYEACSILRNAYDRWKKYKDAKVKEIKKESPPNADNDSTNEEDPRT